MADVHGTNAADVLQGTAGNDRLYGWDSLNAAGDFGPAEDADNIYGGSGSDLIDGGAGNDYLADTSGANTLNGGAGDDTIGAAFQAGNILDGGAGIDLLRVDEQASGALIFTLADPATETVVRGLRMRGIEAISVYASEFADSITGGAWDDALLGAAGNDYLAGGDGNDWLSGGGDRDTLSGGAGDDTFLLFDALGADVIDGGDGIDLLEFQTNVVRRNFTLVVSDSFVMPEGTVVTGVERIDYEGTLGVDLITGGAFGDILKGGGGADSLLGLGGNDTLTGNGFTRGAPLAVTILGGAGNDVISYSQFGGGERIDGGAGIDVLEFTLQGNGVVFAAASLRGSLVLANGATLGGFERVDLFATNGADKVRGGAFGDTLVGLSGNDTLYGGGGGDEVYGGGGNERLYGGAGNDRLFNGDGANVLFGGAGDDVLEVWGNGAQRLYGEEGADEIIGSAGADQINGGAGADRLRGNGGADWFDFSKAPVPGQADVIEDFAAGSDRIRLLARVFGVANGALAAGDFVLGTAAVDAGDRILYDRATGQVWHDADGAGGAGAVLFATVTAGTALSAADFSGF